MMKDNLYDKDTFSRVELLLGNKTVQSIASARIILFGVGGVGSWCAEALIRSGVMHLTIVDPDKVSASNINRQLPATQKTLGELKVQVLKRHLLEINPAAEIKALTQIYTEETSSSFKLYDYDYIIDAIDTLSYKAHLLIEACKTDAKVFSSMGAGLKMNPTQIKIDEFWKVKGCKLASALRQKFRKTEKPAKKFQCIYSEESLQNKGSIGEVQQREANGIINRYKPHTNGAILHITGIYGFMLAGLVINDINNMILE